MELPANVTSISYTVQPSRILQVDVRVNAPVSAPRYNSAATVRNLAAHVTRSHAHPSTNVRNPAVDSMRAAPGAAFCETAHVCRLDGDRGPAIYPYMGVP